MNDIFGANIIASMLILFLFFSKRIERNENMVPVLILFIFAFMGILIALFLSFSQTKVNIRSILEDLGVQADSTSVEKTPFYKWGWHEEGENRISAEHLVKKAFNKAELWLSNEDLSYFETICKQKHKGKNINEEEIKQRVYTIVAHNEALRSWVHEQIRKTLTLVQNVSTQEAQQFLQHAGIESQLERAKSKLIGVEIRRSLEHIGLDIMGLEGKGIEIADPKTEEMIHLNDFQAWKQIVNLFKEEIIKEESQNQLINPGILKSMRAIVDSDYFSGLFSDIQGAEIFQKQMTRAFHNHITKCDPGSLNHFERILYTWKWSDGISFNQNDHNRVRELFLREDLSPRMRELIVEKINENFESIRKLIRLFPRYVIFYGENSRARAFASDQYSRHFIALLETFSSPANVDSMPPTIVHIPEEQMEEIRKSPKRGQNKQTLKDTIERKQELVSVDLAISRDVIHDRGWIINIGTEHFSSEEMDILNRPPFKKYFRFCCDPEGDVDFINNTYNANKSRVQFFTLILDTLVDVSPISKQKQKELLAASSTSNE